MRIKPMKTAMFLVQQQPARSAPPAFATIVREYQAMVYSIGWHFLRDRAVAEELAQDVFLKVREVTFTTNTMTEPLFKTRIDQIMDTMKLAD